MADLPTINAIEELKESNLDAIAALEETLIVEMNYLYTSLSDIGSTLEDMFSLSVKQYEQSKIDAMKLLEQQREDARKKDDEKEKKDSKKDKGPLAELLEFLRNGGLLAGGALLAGLAGAAVGLRGWEGKALANLDKIKNFVPKSITNGIRSLRNGAFAVFGLNAEGKPVRDARGRFTGQRLTVAQQIGQYMQSLKQSTYRFFGLGVDGKPVVKTPAWVKTGLNIGKSVSNVIQSIRNGFVSVLQSVGKFFQGTGGFLKGAATAIGTALKAVPIIGQIIGAVFAIFDGLFTAMDTEGTFAKKSRVFFTAAVSDFIGAPLDLLKDVFSWLAGKFGFKELEEFLESFSIEDELEKFLNGAFEMVGDVFDWIGTLFIDPTQALQQLWDTLTGGVTSMGNWIGNNLVDPAWNWFKGLFGFNEGESLVPEDFDPIAFLSEKVNKLLNFIYDPETGKIFGLDLSMENLMKSLPEIKLPEIPLPDISIPDFPNPFSGLQEKVKNFDYSMFDFGLIDFSDEIKSFMTGLFGEPTQINAESGTRTGAGGSAGAEADVRSREVASQQASPSVNVTAPQTNVNSNTSTNVNKTTMAQSSATRGRSSPQVRDYQDPLFVG